MIKPLKPSQLFRVTHKEGLGEAGLGDMWTTMIWDD